MIWIRPHSINRHWSNVIHKGQSDHHRNPAVWFYPSATRLHIRSGIRSSWNAGVDPGRHLPMYHWTHVTIQHRHGMMRVLYNARQVGRASYSAPLQNGGALYMSNPWYYAAGCRVARFVYAPRILKNSDVVAQIRKKPRAPRVRTIALVNGPQAPRRNRRLRSTAQLGAFTGSFTYLLWIRPQGRYPHWSNVFHKGQSDGNRNPAVWFYPGQTRLHIRSGIYNNGNPGVDPGHQLALYAWTHVAIQHKHGQMRVFYNGGHVGTHNMAGPLQNPGNLWLSNPWYAAAPCKVSRMKFSASYMHPASIAGLARQRPKKISRPTNRGLYIYRRRIRPHQGRVVVHGHDGRWRGSKGRYTGKLSWMFWVYPMGTRRNWCNLFHKGHHNTQRQSAVWFYPGHLRLHIRSGDIRNWNYGHDPGDQMARHRWTHIAWTHRHGLYEVFYNGVKKVHAGAQRPTWNNGPVYISDPWHQACNAYISDLRFYNTIASHHDVRMAVKERAIH